MEKIAGKIILRKIGGIVFVAISLIVAGFAAFMTLLGPAHALFLSPIAFISACVGAILGARRTALFSLLVISFVVIFTFLVELLSTWPGRLSTNSTLPYWNMVMMVMIIVMLVVGTILFRNYRANKSNIAKSLSDGL